MNLFFKAILIVLCGGLILTNSHSASAAWIGKDGKPKCMSEDFVPVVNKRIARYFDSSSVYRDSPPISCVSRKLEKPLHWLQAKEYCAKTYKSGLCEREVLSEAFRTGIRMEQSREPEWTGIFTDYDVEVFVGPQRVDFRDMFDAVLPFRCCH